MSKNRRPASADFPRQAPGAVAVPVQALVDALPGGAIVLDAAGHLLAVNAFWLSCSTGDDPWLPAIGTGPLRQQLDDLAPNPEGSARDSGSVAQHLLAALDRIQAGAGGPYCQEASVQCSGRQRWFRVMAAVIGTAESGAFTLLQCDEVSAHYDAVESGAIARVSAVVAGRTRELEAAKEAAEAASNAKSAFLATVSHELRTPLNAVIALSHLMLQDTDDPLQTDRLQTIAGSAQRLLILLNDILDLSRIEAGRLHLERVDFSLAETVASVRRQVAVAVEEKGLAWQDEIGRDVPARVYGDPLRLGQILLNFAANAAKFTSQGGLKLIVRCCGDDGKRVRLRFEMRDTGDGIAPALAARLFTPFEQADVSTTRKHGGAGLGLAICRHIAELMGGEIGVDSRQGEGSTFWFAAEFAKAAVPELLPASSFLTPLRVLLVGPDQGAGVSLRENLARLGVRLNSARKGTEALTRVEVASRNDAPYDLLVFHGDPGEVARNCNENVVQRLQSPTLTRPPLRVLASDFAQPDAAWSKNLPAGFAAMISRSATEAELRALLSGLFAPPSNPQPPRQPVERAPVAAPPAVPPVGGDMRVLVAEDDPVNRDVLRQILDSAGVATVLACNGEAAVRLAAEQPYDLILMDVYMPVMDGIDATRAIRRQAMNAVTPIIAVTANAFVEDRARCLAAGMDAHVSKPVRPDQIYALLARWVPRKHALDCRDAGGSGAAGRVAAAVDPLRTLRRAGFDIDGSLELLGGRNDRYLQLLRVFRTHHAECVGPMRTLLAAGSFAEAARSAHTIKGAARTVGARHLAESALELETRLKSAPGVPTQDIDACVTAFAEQLTGAIASIDSLLAQGGGDDQE